MQPQINDGPARFFPLNFCLLSFCSESPSLSLSLSTCFCLSIFSLAALLAPLCTDSIFRSILSRTGVAQCKLSYLPSLFVMWGACFCAQGAPTSCWVLVGVRRKEGPLKQTKLFLVLSQSLTMGLWMANCPKAGRKNNRTHQCSTSQEICEPCTTEGENIGHSRSKPPLSSYCVYREGVEGDNLLSGSSTTSRRAHDLQPLMTLLQIRQATL